MSKAESDRDEARAQQEAAEAEAVKALESAKSAKEMVEAAKAGSEAERVKTKTEIKCVRIRDRTTHRQTNISRTCIQRHKTTNAVRKQPRTSSGRPQNALFGADSVNIL